MKNRFPRLTDEKRLELKQKRIEERAKLSLALQLGYYVGEDIVRRFLPTLSVDDIQTRKVISVTHAENKEAKRLNDVWYTKCSASKNDDHTESEEEWKALRAYHEMLEAKYLPSTIDCHFFYLNISEENMADFKKGISISLCDCDCSHYSVKAENISVVADEDGYFTIITLKRD